MRPDGTVKVLDFGLAKAMDAVPGGRDSSPAGHLADSPTITTPAMTQAGMILGTAAYMSPEQARGKAVDKRTDIFAFGCVLFEMLSSRRAFDGEDVADTLSRVIRREPAWDVLPATVPPRIVDVLRLCLEKNLRTRRSDIADVRIDLDLALRAAPAAAAVPIVQRSRAGWMVAAVVALLAVAIAVMKWPAASVERETRLDVVMPEGGSNEFALSPDGERIVFAAGGRLWLRLLDDAEAKPVLGTEAAAYPFWSPDGRYVGFYSQSSLKRVELVSGAVQVLADGLTTFSGGTWNAAGVVLFGMNRVIYQTAPDGKTPIEVTKLSGPQSSHRGPQFLADGRRFLFYTAGTASEQGVYVASLDDERVRRIVEADTMAMLVPPDRIAFIKAEKLLIQRFDAVRGMVTGEPDVLATGVGWAENLRTMAFSVSATGRMAYRLGGVTRIQLRRVDRTGKPLNDLGEVETELNAPMVSPDGRQVAFDRAVAGNRDVWLTPLTGGAMTKFTFDPTVDGFPVWSPDGANIAFESPRSGTYDLYVRPANGSSEERPLLIAPGRQWPLDWSKDGRHLLYFDAEPHQGDLMALPVTGDNRTPVPVAVSEANERTGAFSPDGHWVAYDSNQSGRYEVVVQAFPTPSGKWQVSMAGGRQPRWSRDGRELYYISLDGKLMAAPVRASGGAFEAGSPSVLFQTTVSGVFLRAAYDAAPDGTFVVQDFLRPPDNPIVVVLNWKPKAK